ncbi:MAG: mechanosensitive ion channel domain-containing protein [Balneolales bacterium]
MRDLSNWIADILNFEPELTYKVIISLLIILTLLIFRGVVMRIVSRNVDDLGAHYKWKKNLTYLIVFIGAFLLGRIWVEGFQSIATFLGLIAAGLAIALRDIVADTAAWLYLIWRKPFEIGDRIEIGNIKGDVVDKRLFKFTLVEIENWVDAEQSTGRIMHIPNHKVFSDAIANYTADFQFIWNEIPVRLTFESDWKKAKVLLQEIADKHSANISNKAKTQLRKTAKTYMIVYTILTPTVYTTVKEFGPLLTIRYLTNPRTRRGTQQQIWEDILTEFEKHDDIQFAYPTSRFIRSEPI